MYSFDFKVLLGFCRYVLLFFQKRKTGKSSVPTQMVCHYQPYCMFIHKQRKKHKRIFKKKNNNNKMSRL